MHGKYLDWVITGRWVALSVGFAALLLYSFLSANVIEPIDYEYISPIEWEKSNDKEQERKFESAKERINEGTADEKDWQTYMEYQYEHLVRDSGSATENNSGGTGSEGTDYENHGHDS